MEKCCDCSVSTASSNQPAEPSTLVLSTVLTCFGGVQPSSGVMDSIPTRDWLFMFSSSPALPFPITPPLQLNPLSQLPVPFWMHSLYLINPSFSITHHKPDFLFLTETWLKPGECSPLVELCLPAYTFLNSPRLTGRGGVSQLSLKNIFLVLNSALALLTVLKIF